MLPITKATPKELLPIGRKPLIQYAIEEIVASGIREIILVTAPGRNQIQGYFQKDAVLESLLEKRGRHDEAEMIRSLSQSADIQVAQQDQPLGLGHAVSCARQQVGDEPFALVLPDAFIVARRPCLRQLLDRYELTAGSYIATREVEPFEFARFGILDVSAVDRSKDNLLRQRVHGLVEKPAPEVAPSRFGVFGRYLLEPKIFDYIASAGPELGHEIQLTDALAAYCRDFPVFAVCFEGEHFDVGNELGLLQASVRMGLNNPAIGEEFRTSLREMISATASTATELVRQS